MSTQAPQRNLCNAWTDPDGSRCQRPIEYPHVGRCGLHWCTQGSGDGHVWALMGDGPGESCTRCHLKRAEA